MPRPLYLLQGLAQDTSDWDRALAHLDESTPVTLIDVLTLGFDGTAFSLRRAVADLDRRITDHEAVVCGLSYGAVIAAAHAIDHQAGRHRYVLAGLQVKTGRGPGIFLRTAYPLVHQFMQISSGRRLHLRRVRSQLRMYAGLDLRDDLHRIQSPVMLVNGKLDRVHYKPAADALERIPDARAVNLRLAGHESNRSAPGQFAEALIGFAA